MSQFRNFTWEGVFWTHVKCSMSNGKRKNWLRPPPALGGIHKGRPADPSEGGGSENPDKTGLGGGRGGGWGVRTSEIGKIIFALFSLFLLEIISTYESPPPPLVNSYKKKLFLLLLLVIFIPWEIKESDVRRGRGCKLSDNPGQTGEGSLKISILAGRPLWMAP